MVYQPRAGDVIALDNEKAGALTLSTSLANYSATSTDPIAMFARRDAFRTVAESIASSMANVPLNLYERDETNGRRKLSADEDPVAATLESPTAGLTQYRWVEALQLDHVLHDRWACLVLHNDAGLEFVRLPAQWISFAVDPFRRITHVALYQSSALDREPMLIPIENVLFDVGYDPAPAGKHTRGFSISRTLEASATELEQGAEFRAQILRNGPKVPMYIARPADAPSWDRNGGRTKFLETFHGFSNERAGEAPLLEDGMLLKEAPRLDADKVAYLEARLAAQVEFAIAMHYPPELVGYREGNFSNIAALREHLYVDVLGGRLIAFRQALNAGMRRAGILPPKRYIEENVAVRLQGNPELQASVMQTQVGAPVRTVNEARKLLNLPPVEGGDELIVPLNVTKGGLASPTDTAPKTLGRLTSASPLRRLKATPTPQQYLDVVESRRARLESALRKGFTELADRVSSGLGTDSSPGALDQAFDLTEETNRLSALLLPHSYGLAQAGAEQVLDAFNPERAGFADDVMLPWLAKAATGTATEITSSTFARVALAIAGAAWLAAVTDVLTNLVEGRSAVWAQTISTASVQFGAHDAAKASGLGSKTWIHMASEDSRSEHAAMSGETVGINDVFSNGLRWPGDPSGTADENANCHCRLEYSFNPPEEQ